MNKNIEFYYSLIDKINKKIKDIQDECPHDKGFNEGIQLPGGSIKLCKECNFIMPDFWLDG